MAIRSEIGDKKGLMLAYGNIGYLYSSSGNPQKAIEICLRNLKLAERLNLPSRANWMLANLGGGYLDLGDFEKSLFYNQKSLDQVIRTKDIGHLPIIYLNFVKNYYFQGYVNKALEYISISKKFSQENKDYRYYDELLALEIDIYLKLDQIELAAAVIIDLENYLSTINDKSIECKLAVQKYYFIIADSAEKKRKLHEIFSLLKDVKPDMPDSEYLPAEIYAALWYLSQSCDSVKKNELYFTNAIKYYQKAYKKYGYWIFQEKIRQLKNTMLDDTLIDK